MRHIGFWLRKRIASLFNKLPSSIQTVSDAAIGAFDNIADKVDRNTGAMAHRYLDPKIARFADEAILARLANLDNTSASVLYAKVMYDNLKTATAYFCRSLNVDQQFFISEMLAAVAYGRAASTIQTTYCVQRKAAELLLATQSIGVVRTATGANAALASDDEIATVSKAASFAALLWLIIERGNSPFDEEVLLVDCCDLTLARLEQVNAVGPDVQSTETLLTSCAEIV